jgi:hypothetical protein
MLSHGVILHTTMHQAMRDCNVGECVQITDVMSRGYDNRCVAAHDINAHSSRSHALLIVEVTSTNIATGIRTVGKLTLCDLAGRCGTPVHSALGLLCFPLSASDCSSVRAQIAAKHALHYQRELCPLWPAHIFVPLDHCEALLGSVDA